MILHRVWKFRLLLVALLALIVIHPLTAGQDLARLCYLTFWSFVQIATIYAISGIRWQRHVGLALGLPLTFAMWSSYVIFKEGETFELILSGLSAAFFTAVAVMVMRHLVTNEVTADNVAGAVCAYLLLGLAIGLLYAIIETLHAHSFHGRGELAAELADPVRRRSALTYYSFITLTTAGYGDLTPATPFTRILAAMEAVLGQLYLAILVAGLVGIRVSRRGNGGPAIR
ncbi:MAG TPA: potassium channel family protein [Pirellulales bacterium]|nr:potassium channel family protein [Pirellulales bacterium]